MAGKPHIEILYPVYQSEARAYHCFHPNKKESNLRTFLTRLSCLQWLEVSVQLKEAVTATVRTIIFSYAVGLMHTS